MSFEFQSHSKLKAKLSGTLWTCKQYFVKLLYQYARPLKYIMHFENLLILRLFPQQIIPFIPVNINNPCDAWSDVGCNTPYEFPHG